MNEYLENLRSTFPQRTHVLRQWDALYDKWQADFCELRQRNFFRYVGRALTECDSLTLCNYERYTCCVQFHAIHVCDLIPVVLGSRLDRRLRSVFWKRNTDARCHDTFKIGLIILNRNYFHFSACLNTNPRLCHIYRPTSRKGDTEVRLYFYDRVFRGNKLYLRRDADDDVLTLRNCFTQEYDLWRTSCGLVEENADVARAFVDSCVGDLRDTVRRVGIHRFFEGMSHYMTQTRRVNGDIDLLRNKCVFNGPHLYSLFMQQFAHNLLRFGEESDLDNLRVSMYVQKSRVLAHTANLYMLVSRKTNIRVDVTGGMKRTLKTDVRRTKNDEQRSVTTSRQLSSVIIPKASSLGSTLANSDNFVNRSCDFVLSVGNPHRSQKDIATYVDDDSVTYVASPTHHFNVAQMLIYGKSPFLYNVSSFHFADLEYVFEQLKRLRVENLNAVKCLLMPRESDGFLSHYNIGNISSAGRCMNVCAISRSSTFVNETRVVAYAYYCWARHVCATFSSTKSTLRVVINEIYCGDLRLPAERESVFFILSKTTWPAVQVFRRDVDDFLLVVVNSGAIFIPHSLTPVNSSLSNYCVNCDCFYPPSSFSSRVIHVNLDVSHLRKIAVHFDTDLMNDGSLVASSCIRHIWITPSELSYIKKVIHISPEKTTFYWHEIACHGLLKIGMFIRDVEISKMIVSINADRRKIRFHSSSRSIEPLMDQNTRLLILDDEAPFDAIERIPKRNAFRCFFMFGDVMGRDCEDAYVFNSAFVPYSDTICQFKINFYRHDRTTVRSGCVRYVENVAMSVRRCAGGCVMRLGYIVSFDRLRFGSSIISTYENCISSNLFVYSLFWSTNASYINEEFENVYFDGDCSKSMNAFDDREIEMFGDADTNSSATTSFRATDDPNQHYDENTTLCDLSLQSRCSRVRLNVSMTIRQLRFTLEFRRTRQVYKFQNNCGQKGMPVYTDLSHLRRSIDNGPVHLVVSGYSMIGRTPIAQLLEQRNNAGGVQQVIDSRTNQCVGYGGYGEFFFSCDSPHENFLMSSRIYGTNPVRFCNLTYHALCETGLSSTTFLMGHDHENARHNPFGFASDDILDLLTVYRYYNRDISFARLRLSRRRRILRDAAELRRRGIACRVEAARDLYLSAPTIDELEALRIRNGRSDDKRYAGDHDCRDNGAVEILLPIDNGEIDNGH